MINGGIPMLATNLFLAMGDFATEHAFKWDSNPKILTAPSIIGRVLNDIESHEIGTHY